METTRNSTDISSLERSWNTERRAAVRHRRSLDVVYRAVSAAPGEPRPARARDVSALGVGLLVDQPLDVGILLEIELRRADGMPVRALLARVVHAAEEGAGVWLAGCAFVVGLSRRELRLFGADAVRPPSSDCRRWVRYSCDVETVCFTCDTVPGERRSARVLNISAGGVGLLLGCEFAPGTILQFELPAEASQPDRSRRIRVVRVQEHARGWLTGCEFTDELTDAELAELLRRR